MANKIGLKMQLKAVDKMSSAVKRVAKSFRPLNVAVSKTNRKFKILQGQSEKTRKALTKTGNSMKNVGAKMALGLTAPIVGIGAAIIKTSTDFQAGMNKVEAVTGATGESLLKLRKQARELGRETKFSAGEAAGAMSFLGMAGFNANEIFKATPGILNLAAASGTDLARSADIASNIMGAFNLEAGQSARVADVLALTTAKSNTNMEQLAEGFKDAGPLALKFGSSIESTAALLGKLGDSGIQGSKAGTTLKNMFLKLSAPTKAVKKTLGALGVQVVDPLTKKIRPMTAILKDLNKGFAAKNITQAGKLAVLDKIFGKRAIAGASILLEAVNKVDAKTGVDSITELNNKLTLAKGSAKRMAKVMLKGLPGALAKLKSSTESMLLSFGFKGGFASVAEKVIGKLIDLTKWIGGLDGSTLKLITGIAGIVAVTGPLLVGLGLLLTMLPSMITGFNLIKAAMVGAKIANIGLSLSMLPMIAAIGIFAAGAILVIRQWTPIKEFFKDLFSAKFFSQIGDMFKFASKITGITGLFTKSTDESLEEQGFKVFSGDDKAKVKKKKGSLTKDLIKNFSLDGKLPTGAALKNNSQLNGKLGPALGAKKLTDQGNDFKIRQQKAQIDVNFANMPKETSVVTDDQESILNVIGTGLLGVN